MPSFISQLASLVIALLGTFFKCIKEDSAGKRMYSASGLPLLTKQGKYILILLFVSFGTSLVIAWQSSRESQTLKDKLANIQQQDYEGIRNVLHEQERDETATLSKQKDLLNAQEKSGEKITKTLEDTTQTLEQRVIGSLTAVNSLTLILYLENVPNFTNSSASGKRTVDSVLNLAFCSERLRQARLTVPIGSNINTQFVFSRGSNGTCSIEKKVWWGPKGSDILVGDAEKTADPQLIFFNTDLHSDFKTENSCEIHLTLDAQDFRNSNPYPVVMPSLVDFVPDGNAGFVAQPNSDSYTDYHELTRDLMRILPRAIGIRVLPNGVASQLLTARSFRQQPIEMMRREGAVYAPFKGMPGVPWR
jgi:hypothetical protein